MADSVTTYARARYLVVGVFAASVLPNLVAALLVERTSLTGNLPGWVFGLWILGFIAALLLAIVLMNTTSAAAAVVVFGFGACVPWCLSMIFGVWIVTAVAGAVFVGALALWAYRTVDARYRLEAFGMRAVATVLDVLTPRMNVVVNNVYIRRTLLVEVTLPGSFERYEAKAAGLFEFGTVPQPGARVGVIVDSERPERVVLDTSRPVRRGAPSRRQPFVQELERLATLHRNGDLSDAEYESAKRRLLEG